MTIEVEATIFYRTKEAGVYPMCGFRFVLSLAIINVAGCGCQSEPGKLESQPTIMAYPYEVSADRKKAFVDVIKNLRAGQLSNEVVKLLGPPDNQFTISAKEHDRPLGRRFVYYLKKKGDGVNEHYDQSLCLDFDNRDELASILVQNLPNLVDQIRNLPVMSSNWNELKQEIVSSFKPSNKSE